MDCRNMEGWLLIVKKQNCTKYLLTDWDGCSVKKINKLWKIIPKTDSLLILSDSSEAGSSNVKTQESTTSSLSIQIVVDVFISQSIFHTKYFNVTNFEMKRINFYWIE